MEKIKHKAIVISKDENHICVQIQKENNCNGCPILSFCKAAKNSEIKLPIKTTQDIKIGDEITIIFDAKNENMGILMLYVLPTVIIFAILALMCKSGFSDTACALWSLFALVFYYLGLYLFRKKIDINFNIEYCSGKTDE